MLAWNQLIHPTFLIRNQQRFVNTLLCSFEIINWNSCCSPIHFLRCIIYNTVTSITWYQNCITLCDTVFPMHLPFNSSFQPAFPLHMCFQKINICDCKLYSLFITGKAVLVIDTQSKLTQDHDLGPFYWWCHKPLYIYVFDCNGWSSSYIHDPFWHNLQ